MEDKVRKLMEEASSPQGFQIFTNSYDGISPFRPFLSPSHSFLFTNIYLLIFHLFSFYPSFSLLFIISFVLLFPIGFGAVASGFLEKIDDEYSKPSITFGVAPSHFDPEVR